MRIIFTILFMLIASLAWGQSSNEARPQFKTWDLAAERAEHLVESASALDNILKAARDQLIEDREEQRKYIDENDSNADILKAQLNELGPAPEDGVGENSEIAARRSLLEARIAQAETPILNARQAFARSDSNIKAIEEILNQRFQESLRTRQTSPLNPILFKDSMVSLLGSAKAIKNDIVTSWGVPTQRELFWVVAPLALVLLFLGIAGFLLLPKRLLRYAKNSRQNSSLFRRSFRIFAPSIAIFFSQAIFFYLFMEAIILTSEVGLMGISLLPWIYMLRNAGIAAAFAHWLSYTSRYETDHQLAPKTWYSIALAVLVTLNWSIDNVMQRMRIVVEAMTIEQNAVYHFLIILIAAPIVYRLSEKSRFSVFFNRSEEGYLDTLFEYLRLAFRYGVLIALILLVIGYVAAGNLLFNGVVISTAIIASIYWISSRLIDFSNLLYSRFARQNEAVMETGEVGQSLWPIAISTVVILLAIPFLAMAWGLPFSDVKLLFNRIGQDFVIGDVRISATAALEILIVFIIGYFIVKAIQRILDYIILPRTRLDIGGRTAIVSLFGYLGYTIAAFIALNAAGINLSNLAYIAGALSVGIGFGLQNIVSNFVSGIILLIERPIKKGDWISVTGHEGYVRDIAVRSTEIETFDNATVIVPNADLVSSSVLNWVHATKSARVTVPIGVAYDEDPREIERLLLEVAGEIELALKLPEPVVMFMNFGESSLDFELRFFIREADYMLTARSECNFRIFDKFKEHGISIPFPQRDVRIIEGGKG